MRELKILKRLLEHNTGLYADHHGRWRCMYCSAWASLPTDFPHTPDCHIRQAGELIAEMESPRVRFVDFFPGYNVYLKGSHIGYVVRHYGKRDLWHAQASRCNAVLSTHKTRAKAAAALLERWQQKEGESNK